MTRKPFFVLTMAAALLLIAGIGLYAAGPEVAPQFVKSSERQASAGQFWSDPDMFINPKLYTEVDFDKWFGFIAFSPFNNLSHSAQFGVATQFGDLYTALYYGGNMWRLGAHSYIEEEADFYNMGKKTVKRYASEAQINRLNSSTQKSDIYNEVALLFGIADMGFRLAFASDFQARSVNEDFMVGGSATDPSARFYKNFSDAKGWLTPQLAWGMTKGLTDRGIQPHVYVDFGFNRDYRKYEQYKYAQINIADENDPPDLVDKYYSAEVIERSNNSFNVGLTAAAGGLSLVEQNGFTFGLDLWYVLGLTTYNNEYNFGNPDEPGSGKNYKGKYTTGGSLAEEGGHGHNVIPYLYAFWEGGKVKLSAELGLNAGFGGSRHLGLKADNSGKLIQDGPADKTGYFSFNPTLDLGMQWAIVAEKFFLNAGCGIDFGGPTLSTTKTEIYTDGKKENIPVATKKEREFDGAATTLTLGVTFNPVKNIGLQAMCGVSTSNNGINVFSDSADGLFVFSQILAIIKF
ncbi:MAG: hypothetical protein FWD36_06705 [Treponema sp.]|nr:hypothetical protein [Treponema sp.]